MTIRSKCCKQFAALSICIALGACSDGYPRKDLGVDNPTTGVSATEIVARLNRMNEISLTPTKWHFAIVNRCQLQLLAKPANGADRFMTVGLLRGDFQIKGNLGGPVFAVQVDFSENPALLEEHLFEADRWTDAVEYATNLQALQRICANDR